MKRKIVWLGVSWLIVAALVLASCGPTVPGEQEQEEEVVTLSIGETYQTPEVAVTVSEAIVTDSFEYYDEASESMSTEEAKPGTFFLIFTAEINNVGSSKRYNEGARHFQTSDSEGNTYLMHKYLSSYFGENQLKHYKLALAPGEEIKGKVLFRIPEGAGDLKIAYMLLESGGEGERTHTQKKLAEWEIE